MKFLGKKLNPKHKNNKFLYYLKCNVRLLLPAALFRWKLNRLLAKIDAFGRADIMRRVNYYNKLKGGEGIGNDAISFTMFKRPDKYKVYFFDSYEFLRYFKPSFLFKVVYGDLTKVPESPAVVKSRPVDGDNRNSVLLNINKIRHFLWVNDHRTWNQKKDMLVSRNSVSQPHRYRFLEMYFGHPMCNIGQTNRSKVNPAWQKGYMTIDEQLDYKFILCIEGNDVASNLKWVMSSNSLAVMPKPKYETWFMEGRLVPNVHYVQIKDDYSDLEERLRYYIANPDKAQEIINNAHQYLSQFKDKKREKLISLMVLEKYFYQTRQKESAYAPLFT